MDEHISTLQLIILKELTNFENFLVTRKNWSRLELKLFANYLRVPNIYNFQIALPLQLWAILLPMT
jgi:hypothetical protein